MQDPLAQQREASLPIHLPFQQLEPLDLGFCRSITPWQGQPCFHRPILLPQTLGKRAQFSYPVFLYLLKPPIQALPLQLPRHLDEAVDVVDRHFDIFVLLT